MSFCNVLEVPFNAIKVRNYSVHPEAETLVPQSHEMGHF